MARYHTGARAEYRLKHELEKKGWHVIRAAGSHGKWDLVAVRKRNGRVDVLLIQVKRRQPPKKPIATFYRNCSVLDCFVFFAPRKGPFLSKDWRFSVSDLSSIVVSYWVNSEQSLVLNNESAPNSVAVIAVAGQPILVVGEHAAVQQNPATTRNCKEGKAMEVTKSCKVNRNASGTVRTEPSQHPALSGSCRDVSNAPEKMPVPDKDIETTTARKFHLKRIVELASEEPRMNFNSPFPETCSTVA
jgi:Holliday junction resolvase